MGHPLRVQILAELNQRVMFPTEFVKRCLPKNPNKKELSKVSYHFRQLRNYKCIEEVETRRVRGATEHYYKATKRALFDGKAWEELPESIRAGIDGQIVTDFLNATAKAMLAETMEARIDKHASWTETRLDEKGWSAAAEAYREFLARMVKISREAKQRLAGADDPGLMAIYALFLFESPLLQPGEDEAV
jgi:hypothetical protein